MNDLDFLTDAVLRTAGATVLLAERVPAAKCAWCGTILDARPVPVGQTSHGICPCCRDKMQAETTLDLVKPQPKPEVAA